MNFDFSDQVRFALKAAREEAVRLGHDYVGTEHILLGLLDDRHSAEFIRSIGETPERVRTLVEKNVRPGRSSVLTGELPYTSRAKKVLEFAMAAARDLRSKVVFPGHLLLGLLREERGIAAVVLTTVGITEERVRFWAGTAQPEVRSRFHITIDDRSGQSIYEQIIAQVTEAVATEALRAGERMPSVRQLADELDIAPGTVARAYSELEQQGLLVTEGPRGTHVAARGTTAPQEAEKINTLTGLLRPVAVAAFHLGASASDLRAALDAAMAGIFDKRSDAA